MSIIIDIFFVAAPLAALYVLTSFLTGTIRYIAFAAEIIAYLAVIYFAKDYVKKAITIVLDKVSHMDKKKMYIIIFLFALISKVIFTIFFNYDGTQSGDIKIYNDIAEQIIETHSLHTDAISHLYGLALHFVLFKLIRMPIHIGLFIVCLIGTSANFFSFCRLIGKDKAFLAVMIYLLMPSTALMVFCPTHELFVYMYVSLFLFFFNKMIYEEETAKTILWFALSTMSTVLTCFVNPGGYIIYVILLLSVILSNMKINKKVLAVGVLLLSFLFSNLISDYLEINEYNTTINTYTILIHGANPESLGEQVDGYPLKQMRQYIYDNTLDFSQAGFVDAAKNVLINHYKYLLTHPIILLRLLIHKTYMLWSGVHYPIELANYYGAVSGPIYYIFLGISTLIYLTVLTIGNVFKPKCTKTDDDMALSNYKLEFLGVIALTFLCIVVNKYSLYVTLFIYLIAFSRAEFEENENNC